MNYHPLLMKGYANSPILFDMSGSKPLSLYEKIIELVTRSRPVPAAITGKPRKIIALTLVDQTTSKWKTKL